MSDRHEGPLSSGEAVEMVARLIEQSSLGTVGARQLRDRTDALVATRIRAQAYFSASTEGEAWWDDNRNDAEALFAAACDRTNGDADDREISRALLRLAAGLGH